MAPDGYEITEGAKGFRLRVWARNERELFSRSLLALAAVMRPDAAMLGGKTIKVRARVCGEDLFDTLINFLRRAAFECAMHGAVFFAMDVIRLGPDEIDCELIGKITEHFEEEVDHIHSFGKGIERAGGRLGAEFRAAVI